jgi:hypothetical protein
MVVHTSLQIILTFLLIIIFPFILFPIFLRFYVEENEEWQLKFVAESMLNENSLVAIDDVVVSSLPCDERTSCDFEESICLWEDDSTHMWARGVEETKKSYNTTKIITLSYFLLRL